MKLSFIFELLLIFVFLAFAASRVIDSEGSHLRGARRAVASTKLSHKNRQTDQNQPNRYCSCNAKLCNCCRDFNIPVVSLRGPGCASLQYLTGDKLAISMSFGERVLTNTTISGRRPKPICMPLPGGVSKFCGRVYNIKRQGEDFNACLGLELRALNDVEAALRVSCFKFGADGLKVQPAQPLPAVEEDNDDDDDDDEDDDDDYDDEDDFDFDDDEDDDDDEEDNDVEAADYESFGLLDDDFIDGLFVGEAESDGDDDVKKPVVKKPVKKITATKAPLKNASTRKPLRRKVTPKATTPKPKITTTTKKIVTTPKSVETTTTPVLQAVQMIQVPEPSNVVEPIKDIKKDTINETINDNLNDKINKIDDKMNDTLPDKMSEMINVKINEIPDDAKTNKTIIHDTPITITSYEATVQVVTDSTPTPSDETTLKAETTTEDEYIEEGDEPEQNYIIKNDDDDESEEDPITSMVEDVLDDDEDPKKNTTKIEELKVNTNVTDKKESKDVVDDVIDGVADIVSDDDSEETKDDDKKDDDDDDDIFDDDDDEDSEEDEDEDDEEARSGKFRRSRQSKDMRS